jgi:hypothetical protein
MSVLEPQSVDQILAVLEQIRQNRRLGFGVESSTSRAIHEVASQYGIRYQTIGDGCRRRLGLQDISGFHRLVTDWLDGNATPLKSIIKRNASAQAVARIDSFFSESGGSRKTPEAIEQARIARAKPLELTIPGPDARMLRVLAEVEGSDESLLALELLNGAVRDRFRAVFVRSVKG